MSKLQELETFLQDQHPQIRYVTPSGPGYAELRQTFILDNPAAPLAIVRPQNAEDVASLVAFAVAADIDITVRTGGHDMYGRCFAQDALAIDMRDISYVKVDDTKPYAAIGGGTLAEDVATGLTEHKLVTPSSRHLFRWLCWMGNIRRVQSICWQLWHGHRSSNWSDDR